MGGKVIRAVEGNAWVDPTQCVGVAFTAWVKMALATYMVEGQDNPQAAAVVLKFREIPEDEQNVLIEKLVNSLTSLVDFACHPDTPDLDMGKVINACGYYELDERVQRLFDHLFTRVVLSQYFKAAHSHRKMDGGIQIFGPIKEIVCQTKPLP